MKLLRHLPNALSITRGLCGIPILLLTLQDLWIEAFWLTLIAGASDGLDGWLAKRYGWQSRFGAGIDPIADKVLLLSALIALTLGQDIPLWFLLLALARDVCIVLGAYLFNARYHGFTPQPSLLGKVTTLSLIVMTLLELGTHAYRWPLHPLLDFWLWLTAALLVASWLNYGWRWHVMSKNALKELALKGKAP